MISGVGSLCVAPSYCLFVFRVIRLAVKYRGLGNTHRIFTGRRDAGTVRVRLISLLTLRLLRLLESNCPGNSLWAWEFLPLKLRLCLSQTL